MVCQNCGAENLPDSRFCDSCGHALTPAPVVQPAPVAQPQAPAPVPPAPVPAQPAMLPPAAPSAVGSGLPPTVAAMPAPPPPPVYAAPPPAAPASPLYAAACSRCGAALKPGAQFCGSCGQPLAPGAALGTPATMARPAGGGGSGCGKLLGCGCVFLLLLLGLGAGGVVIGSRTLLSSPKAFVGVWKVLDTEKGKATELGSFKAEVAGDGLKVKPAGNVDDVIAFEMKRNGVRSFKGRATNPDNKDEWADLTLTMGFWGRRLAVSVEASDGEKENWSAQRDLQATLEDAVKQ